MLNLILRAMLLGPLAVSAPLVGRTPAPARLNSASAVAPAARSAAAAVDGFHAALRRGDTRAAAALLADDVLIFESGEVERSKAEYASHHLGADAEFSAAIPSRMTRRSGQANGAIAWIASEGHTTGSFHGKPLDELTTETMVLRRGSAGWKIVQIHWSSTKAR